MLNKKSVFTVFTITLAFALLIAGCGSKTTIDSPDNTADSGINISPPPPPSNIDNNTSAPTDFPEGNVVAPWRPCYEGSIHVDAGFINWLPEFDPDIEAYLSPWDEYYDYMFEIHFDGPIIAGEYLFALFSALPNLTTIEGLEYFDTSSVKSMRYMFALAHSLFAVDLSSWNTVNVTDMGGMFAYATDLKFLSMAGWDTSGVTDMSEMFMDASSLTYLDLSGWDTNRDTINMFGMFEGADNLTTLFLGENTRFTDDVQFPAEGVWHPSTTHGTHLPPQSGDELMALYAVGNNDPRINGNITWTRQP